jgi:hypothetical protein
MDADEHSKTIVAEKTEVCLLFKAVCYVVTITAILGFGGLRQMACHFTCVFLTADNPTIDQIAQHLILKCAGGRTKLIQ